MTFAWPHVLWLLAAPAAFVLAELAARRAAASAAHPKIRRAEAGMRSVNLAPAEAGGPVRGRPRWWLASGLALAIAALARPQWGRLEEPAYERSREVVIALDLSRSMLTADVKPSRLARAKLLVESLLDRLEGERVGLVIFSGTAFLQSPLSADYEILREFLPALGPGYMPVGGTNYGAMIDTAAAAFSEGGGADRFLIVLSDGGATDDGWRSHVRKLTDKGIRVIGLGVGTEAGGFIPDGAGGFMKDASGAVVLSRLDNGTLRELAAKTGGTYRDAAEWVDLAGLLRQTIQAGRKGRFVERNRVLYAERFQWALAPALLCLLASFWLEFPVTTKPREVRLKAGPGEEGGGPPGPRGRTAAALACAILALAAGASGRAQEDDLPQAPANAEPLARVVGRLADADTRTALDWAEMSEETLAWGTRLQAAQQPVPPGPVRDGLAAADAGAALDPRAADWPKLRSELEALLRQPPRQKKPPPKPQSQRRQQPPQRGNSQSRQGSRPQGSSGAPQGQPPPQGGTPREQSAFGSMNQGAPPPQDAGTQSVGGPRRRPQSDPALANPELAASVEKLDRLRDQDSPAELYQMIQNSEPHPAEKPAKDW